jgi:large subunit ribosomal protein L37Ae
MSRRTKKVGSTGWMGSRYGIRIRRRVLEIDRERRKAAPCPRCSTTTVHRVASGVYECRRCGTKFSSGAYVFSPAPSITRSERTEGKGAASAPAESRKR